MASVMASKVTTQMIIFFKFLHVRLKEAVRRIALKFHLVRQLP
jgi:hypothetical protein